MYIILILFVIAPSLSMVIPRMPEESDDITTLSPESLEIYKIFKEYLEAEEENTMPALMEDYTKYDKPDMVNVLRHEMLTNEIVDFPFDIMEHKHPLSETESNSEETSTVLSNETETEEYEDYFGSQIFLQQQDTKLSSRIDRVVLCSLLGRCPDNNDYYDDE